LESNLKPKKGKVNHLRFYYLKAEIGAEEGDPALSAVGGATSFFLTVGLLFFYLSPNRGSSFLLSFFFFLFSSSYATACRIILCNWSAFAYVAVCDWRL
jgi:hypothetical protein